MKIKLTREHLMVLDGIVASIASIRAAGEIDVGPSSDEEAAEIGVLAEICDWDSALDCWQGIGRDDDDAPAPERDADRPVARQSAPLLDHRGLFLNRELKVLRVLPASVTTHPIAVSVVYSNAKTEVHVDGECVGILRLIFSEGDPWSVHPQDEAVLSNAITLANERAACSRS